MRVKKYNVDVSNSISSIDMSGKIEYSQDYSITSRSMDRSTVNNIGLIHLSAPGIPSPLTKMDRKISLTPKVRGGIRGGIIANELIKNVLPENPDSEDGSKSSSSSSSQSQQNSPDSQTLGDNRIHKDDPNSTHARRSLSSKTSSDSSVSYKSSSPSSSSGVSMSDSDSPNDDDDINTSRDNYAIIDNQFLDPVIPPRKSVPSAPSPPSSESSASSADRYTFPSAVYREETAVEIESKKSEPQEGHSSHTSTSNSPKQTVESMSLERTNPTATDESTDEGHASSHDDSPKLNKREVKGFYGKYHNIYNQQIPENTSDELPSYEKEDFESNARSDSPENEAVGKNIIEVRQPSLLENLESDAKLDEIERTRFPEAASATAKNNTTEMPRIDGDKSIDAQPEQLSEIQSTERKRSLDKERRFQLWLEHGVYIPASGSDVPSNESDSESTPTSTESEEETKEDEDSKKWWKHMGSVFQRKEEKPATNKESSQSTIKNGYKTVNDNDVYGLSIGGPEFGHDERVKHMDELDGTKGGEGSLAITVVAAGKSKSQSTHIPEDDHGHQTNKETGATGGSFADQVAARSRARMKNNTEQQNTKDFKMPHQRKNNEKSASASRESLADQIAAAARSKKKNASQIRSSEDYDKPYQGKTEVKKKDMSLADQIAAAAKERKSKERSTPRAEEEYETLYKPKKEVKSTGTSLSDQIAANAVRLKNQSAPKTEDDYDRLYSRSKSYDSADESLAEQVAAAANAVKLKNQSTPKTEEDYDRLYDSKEARDSGDKSLADQIASAARAVRTTPMTEEDYEKLYDPNKEREDSNALANQIAAAAMARRRNKSEEDFDTFYQKPQQSNKEPQLMFKLKPVEHRRTRAQRYFQDQAASSGSDNLEDLESSISSSHKSNRSGETPDNFEDDIEKSISSSSESSREFKVNSGSLEDVETSISSAYKSSGELNNASRMTKPSLSSTPSLSHESTTKKQKSCRRPFICYTTIIIITIVAAATAGILYFLVFAEKDNGNDSGTPGVPTRFPSLPAPLKPTASIPYTQSPMPSFRRSTNPRTNQPTSRPTSRPTSDPTVLESFPSQQTSRPILVPTAGQSFPTPQPTNRPVPITERPTFSTTIPMTLSPTPQPTNRPIVITEKPTLPKPSESPQAVLLRQMLVSRWPPLERSLNVLASPQSEAFDWLVDSGTWYSEQQLIQRFVMATFFFSTNGIDWSNNEGWLSTENECQWFQTKSYDEHCDSSGNLLRLELNGNNLSGSIPSELALLSNSLNGLDLAKNTRSDDRSNAFLTGPLPSEMGLLTSLVYMSLGNQQLTGTLPNEIGQLSLLNVLDLTRNNFEGPLVASIGNLKRLYNLYLGFNYLTGAIPSGVGEMKFLVNLDLQENFFSSSLPNEFENLSYLQSLSLGGNKLTGTIPSFLGQLSVLGGSLDLSDNRLSGRIPTELGQLSMLRTVLNLSSNQLSGPIPIELDQLVKLGNLQLQKNLLTGSIPPSFYKLTELQLLQLEYNNLAGDVAASVCDALVTNKVEKGIIPTTLITDCLIEVDCECCQYCCAEIGGCECQFANTDKDFLCRYGDVLGPEARIAEIFI